MLKSGHFTAKSLMGKELEPRQSTLTWGHHNFVYIMLSFWSATSDWLDLGNGIRLKGNLPHNLRQKAAAAAGRDLQPEIERTV